MVDWGEGIGGGNGRIGFARKVAHQILLLFQERRQLGWKSKGELELESHEVGRGHSYKSVFKDSKKERRLRMFYHSWDGERERTQKMELQEITLRKRNLSDCICMQLHIACWLSIQLASIPFCFFYIILDVLLFPVSLLFLSQTSFLTSFFSFFLDLRLMGFRVKYTPHDV